MFLRPGRGRHGLVAHPKFRAGRRRSLTRLRGPPGARHRAFRARLLGEDPGYPAERGRTR